MRPGLEIINRMSAFMFLSAVSKHVKLEGKAVVPVYTHIETFCYNIYMPVKLS